MKTEQLISWRRKHGYTQKQLASILDVAGNTIYRWEKGMREIPPFLHLALECMDKKGGKRETKRAKKRKNRKEVKK